MSSRHLDVCAGLSANVVSVGDRTSLAALVSDVSNVALTQHTPPVQKLDHRILNIVARKLLPEGKHLPKAALAWLRLNDGTLKILCHDQRGWLIKIYTHRLSPQAGGAGPIQQPHRAGEARAQVALKQGLRSCVANLSDTEEEVCV